ncbi:hypothetical protein SAY87_015614 [Trapa incisa]|uniref:Uncharacterized protein n=1 Tax=Trapa incisa TaxID=236973 RepID=A0AAN7QY71_9MYRT|nr:hypothetical protein SAY87_015614 [Trapa incisa]
MLFIFLHIDFLPEVVKLLELNLMYTFSPRKWIQVRFPLMCLDSQRISIRRIYIQFFSFNLEVVTYARVRHVRLLNFLIREFSVSNGSPFFCYGTKLAHVCR